MTELRLGLAISYTISALTDLVLPFALAIFLARRYRAAWRWWFVGIAVFLLFQVLTRIPVMVVVQSLPAVKQGLTQPGFFWSFLLVAAFSAGLFEEGGRWLAFRYIVPPNERRWGTALMLGAGHGGLEVFGVGLLQVAALVGYIVLTLASPETFAAYGQQGAQARSQFASLHGWEPLLGAWERISALAIQVGLTVMVLNAFRRGPHWWWLALAAHTFVDFTSVGMLQISVIPLGRSLAMVATEILVTAYALLAMWFVWRQREAVETTLLSADGPTDPAVEADTATVP